MTTCKCCRFGVFAAWLALAAGWAHAADKSTVPPPPAASVDAAVAKLVAEANAEFGVDAKLRITVVRPHPAVANLPISTVHEVLRAMSGRLTGDPLKDTYVRYHLMYVVNRAQDEGDERFTKELLTLAGLIPKDLKIELKPWRTYEPADLAAKYYQLMNSCIVSVGFPPFNRSVGAPDSFQYMDAALRARSEKNYAEAQTLLGKFKVIESPQNVAHNYRMIYMNWIIRDYRGEILYDLVAQDDPRALERIIDALVAAAATDPVRATDLASFLNKAYFDGMLGKHTAAELKSMAKKLRAAGSASERAAHEAGGKGPGVKGPTMSAGWINGGGRWRHVPESLFTLVFGIENDRVPNPIKPVDRIRPVDTLPPFVTRAKPVTADTIDLEMIDTAIARGTAALEKMRPPDVDLNTVSYTALGLPASLYYPDFTLPGQGALATWAILNCGDSSQAYWMQRRLNWILCYESPTTYDRAMRLQALAAVGNARYDPWLKRDTAWLCDTMTEQGNWEANNFGARSAGFGDNANGQYAILGLWAAEQSGIEVPTATWQRADAYWRAAQRPSVAPGAGGWAVTSSASVKKGANLNAFANQVSASMTAGGTLSLYLTEMYLYGPKKVEVGQTYSPELQHGLDWLDANFSLEHLDGDSDFYYYVWTIQNVGQTTGYRTFNKVDWFRETLARLLNTQQPDGLWAGPKGAHVSTSFALLYLSRARGPLGICKVRFDPSESAVNASGKSRAQAKSDPTRATGWNNRPNDMYNLVTDVGRRLESPTSWQIVDLDQPVFELIESPLLYLATDKAFKLSPDQVQRLREYIDAGGMLVCVPEGKTALAAPIQSMKALAAELCPGIEPIRRADKTHAFYTLSGKMNLAIPTISYETIIRPRVVIIEKDVSRELQANSNKPKERDAFELLANIYLYAVGKDSHRPRIVTNFLIERNKTFKLQLNIARVNCGSNFDPEPLAMPQLKAFIADNHRIDLNVRTAAPEAVDSTVKMAFLTIAPETKLSDAQAAALSKWMEAGGTMWIDAAGGSSRAIAALDVVIRQLGLDEKLVPANDQFVATGSGLLGGYDVSRLAPRGFRNELNERATLKVSLIGARPAAYVCRGDLSAGLAGMNHYGICGFPARTARALVANSLLTFVPIPATQPAARPTTGPSTAPTTGPTTLATTRPTTQPTGAPVNAADELMWPTTHPATQPTTLPAGTQPASPTTRPAQ